MLRSLAPLVLALVMAGCAESQLIVAVRNRDMGRIPGLISERPDDLNSRDGRYGYTSLMIASRDGNLQAVRMLLKAGANVNLVSPKRRVVVFDLNDSALTLALRNNHSEVSAELIRAGADLNFTTLDGWKPIGLAGDENELEVLELMLARGADINWLHSVYGSNLVRGAVVRCDERLLRFLIARKANLNHRGEDSNAMMAALANWKFFTKNPGRKASCDVPKSISMAHTLAEGGASIEVSFDRAQPDCGRTVRECLVREQAFPLLAPFENPAGKVNSGPQP